MFFVFVCVCFIFFKPYFRSAAFRLKTQNCVSVALEIFCVRVISLKHHLLLHDTFFVQSNFVFVGSKGLILFFLFITVCKGIKGCSACVCVYNFVIVWMCACVSGVVLEFYIACYAGIQIMIMKIMWLQDYYKYQWRKMNFLENDAAKLNTKSSITFVSSCGQHFSRLSFSHFKKQLFMKSKHNKPNMINFSLFSICFTTHSR